MLYNEDMCYADWLRITKAKTGFCGFMNRHMWLEQSLFWLPPFIAAFWAGWMYVAFLFVGWGWLLSCLFWLMDCLFPTKE